jgi:hypothetical protein
MRAVTVSGRWVWGLSGLVTAAALAIPGARLITTAGADSHQPPQDAVTRTVTVPSPVTSLSVQSYGGLVRVTAGPVRRVRVIETIAYDKQEGGPPAVTQAVSGGHLSLASPACASSDCSVDFAVTVPPGVTVSVATDGGPAEVSGTAGAVLDSSGGPVTATGLNGSLTVSTNGGTLMLNGLAGTLRADTDGGPVIAQGVAAASATVTTGGGDARISFSAAPDTVTVSTAGGDAVLTVPGGPYALTADSGGGPQAVDIATDPAAGRSLTVTTGGGSLQIGPSAS